MPRAVVEVGLGGPTDVDVAVLRQKARLIGIEVLPSEIQIDAIASKSSYLNFGALAATNRPVGLHRPGKPGYGPSCCEGPCRLLKIAVRASYGGCARSRVLEPATEPAV